MTDDLAKAMHDGLSGFDPAVRNPRWDELPGWVQESYRRQARAVQDYFGLPESAEKGAVGKAVEVLKRLMTLPAVCRPGASVSDVANTLERERIDLMVAAKQVLRALGDYCDG